MVYSLSLSTGEWRTYRRRAATQEELDRVAQGHQRSSRRDNCAFVRGGTEPLRMTYLCQLLIKL